MVLPSDFDIFRPSSSTKNPCVRTARNGGAPRVPRPTSSELWNQPRCWSLPSRYRSAGHVSSGRNGRTASWLEPESNQTSRMLLLPLEGRPAAAGHVSPAGTNSSIGRSYHASAPCSSNTFAACSTISAVRIASPQLVQSSAGIGTPHARWREMHQSGRLATMLKMRSWPHGGIHSTSLSIAWSAASRSVCGERPSGVTTGSPSIRMNHCDVARKITGLWHRQQCGYVCWYGS